MEICSDFEEFFALLNEHEVRYLIVGGYAFAIHARPRFTDDLDIFLWVEEENARRALEALKAFGFGDLPLSLSDFLKPNQIIQIGHPPLRIDLLTSIEGVQFEDAWERRVTATYGSETVYFISREDLIRNKQAAGRKQDLSDLEYLE